MKFAAAIFILIASFAAQAAPAPLLLDLDHWMQWQAQESVRRIFANISPNGAMRGAVIASPQQQGPDYFYIWTRDAAVTMNAVLDLDLDALEAGATNDIFEQALADYVSFTRHQQQTQNQSPFGAGVAKFEANGAPFMGGWCNPQNDGPALRAGILMRYAQLKRERGESTQDLYDGTSQSPIKSDLEYVAHHWQDDNCEPWEEVHGHHFYNLMVQEKAMKEGAKLARASADPGAANFYEAQAAAIARDLTRFWSEATGAFIPTLDRSGGIDYKSSGLDSSTVLAVLHSQFDGDAVVRADDPKFASTVETLTASFKTLYPINKSIARGVAIGRYPEDMYGGTNFLHGNPWVLLTAAFANASYKIAVAKWNANDATQAKLWLARGDAFMERVQTHANPDGSFSEQIDRDTGYQLGARDLTWSHVEVVQAARARSRALAIITH